MERKGFGIRFGAFLIDLVILIIIQAIISFILIGSLNVNFGTSTPTAVSAEDLGKIRMASIVSGLLMLAYWSLEIFRAQSVGKMALGMRIGNAAGTVPADTGTLAMRYAVKNSPGIVNLLAALSGVTALGYVGGALGLVFFIGCFFALGQSRQALHDMIAKTAVYGPAKQMVGQGFQPVMPGAAVGSTPGAPPPRV